MSVKFAYDSVTQSLTQASNVAASSSYTVMFWTKISPTPINDDMGAYRTVFLRMNAGYTAYAGIFTNDDRTKNYKLIVNNGSGEVSSASIPYRVSQWFHVAIVNTGTTYRLVVNGITVATVTADTSAVTFSTLKLGNDGVSNPDFVGLSVAYFREWNFALTNTEIEAEKGSNIPVRTTSLITDTSLATTYNDSTVHGNNWTPVGSPTFTVQPVITLLTNIAITLTGDGPEDNFGRNVMVIDLITGELIYAFSAIDELDEDTERSLVSIIYRPDYDDFLLLTQTYTQAGSIFRIDRYFNIVEMVYLTLPVPLPTSERWDRQLVRLDHNDGLYVTYQSFIGGTNQGDQFIRKVDPLTFQPLVPDQVWRTFYTPLDSSKTFNGSDFSLDGLNFFFSMVGGPGLDQNIVYKLNLTTSAISEFMEVGTWSGGINPSGDTFRSDCLIPRSDGTYVSATFNIISGVSFSSSIRLVSADGTITATYPVTPPESPFTSYRASGLFVIGDILWFVTDIGGFSSMNLTTGTQTVIIDHRVDEDESTLSWGDLIVLLPGSGPTNSLTVTKVSTPTSGSTPFPFTSIGGLVPPGFSLIEGQSRVYTNIDPGIYSVLETSIPAPWTPAYEVSTGGTDNLNITMTETSNITLTVTNTMVGDIGGMYFINPTKATKHDSYYNSVEKKIPNPTIKTALIGD